MTEALKKLEAIVHPLGARRASRNSSPKPRKRALRVVVLDIPLLFETGGHGLISKVVVVSAPADVQRDRVLARPEMTEEKFEAMLERQCPIRKNGAAPIS